MHSRQRLVETRMHLDLQREQYLDLQGDADRSKSQDEKCSCGSNPADGMSGGPSA